MVIFRGGYTTVSDRARLEEGLRRMKRVFEELAGGG